MNPVVTALVSALGDRTAAAKAAVGAFASAQTPLADIARTAAPMAQAAPSYGGGGYSGGGATGGGAAAVRAAAQRAGFTGEALRMAVAIAMAESGGVPQKSKFPGEESYGAWQVHLPSHPQYSKASVMDLDGGARAAFAISGGGANWKPWSVYKSGAYRQYL